MVNSYDLNGMDMQAIELFHQILREFLHEATYVCALNARSHARLVSQARLIFQNIVMKAMRIYSILIDCLSRALFFAETQESIEEYERNHSPEPTMYMALLSGARNAKNIYLSQNIYDRMKNLFPQRKNLLISAAVLLANTYMRHAVKSTMHQILNWKCTNQVPKKRRSHMDYSRWTTL
ncbi:unnamed protein product, partial [Rotaria magnacalcarata]